MIYVDGKMVDFRDPKKLLITAATGIAYFFLRNRMLPENPVVDAAAAGGAYFASTRTTGNVKAALEGVAIGAGASLALSLAKAAPEVFAAVPTAKAPAAVSQPQQIVVHVPPPPPPPPPVVQVSPQIALSQEQEATQVVEVSQEVSQQLEQLQKQLEELSRRLEEATQPQPSPSPSPPSEESVIAQPVEPAPSPPPPSEPVYSLPEPVLPKEPVVTLPEEPGSPWRSPWIGITQPVTSGPVTTTEPMLSSQPQEPVYSFEEPAITTEPVMEEPVSSTLSPLRSFSLLNVLY